ncbi:MAG: phosphatidylglycerol lysyltransferase domain-containing protein, partial [Kiritimatiellales bacterium]
LVVFGSGDGGWSAWEHVVATRLQEANLAVVAFDFEKYSAADFDQPTLVRDMADAAAFAAKRLHAEGLPVLYGGWSMGAAQAIAAARGTNRPPELAGLLLMSLDSRGRYGIRAPDLVGITPAGPGTFDLNEFNPDLRDLRVVQYHGTADFMAQTTWIRFLKSPHQLYLLKGMNHGFDGLSPEFTPVLLQGAAWALGDDSAAAPPEKGRHLRPVRMIIYGSLLLMLLAGMVSRRAALMLLPASVALCGFSNILDSIIPSSSAIIDKIQEWIPLEVSQHGRFILFLSGAMLLALACGLRRRKRVAWNMAAVILSVSAVLDFTQTFNWNRSAVALVILAALFRRRKLFDARSDVPSFRLGIAAAGVMFLLLAGYGTAAIHGLGVRGVFGDPLSWAGSFRGAVFTALQIKTELNELAGREASHLLHTIRLQGLFIGFFTLIMVLRPVILRRRAHSPADFENVNRLVETYSDDPMAVFALLPDKHYYFEEGVEGVVAYALWWNIAVVLADPICRPDCREKLVHGFIRHCRSCDWKPVFYCLNHVHRDIYERVGFQLIRIAEEARLRLADFKLDGARFQNLRTARNKARKNGLVFGWYGGEGVAPDEQLERQLLELSKEWLARKRGGEMGFDLSSFNPQAVREKGAAVVRSPSGRLEAFATWHSYAHGRGRCLDLMRSHAEARDVMDFLILEAIQSFRDQGIEEICFGSAPLANTSDPSEHSMYDRSVRFVFENLERFYGYKRLFFFKQKYQPCWEARYLAYPCGTSLLLVGVAIAGVHLTHGFRSLLRGSDHSGRLKKA